MHSEVTPRESSLFIVTNHAKSGGSQPTPRTGFTIAISVEEFRLTRTETGIQINDVL